MYRQDQKEKKQSVGEDEKEVETVAAVEDDKQQKKTERTKVKDMKRIEQSGEVRTAKNMNANRNKDGENRNKGWKMRRRRQKKKEKRKKKNKERRDRYDFGRRD